jgi:hypothetical protein
MRAAPLLVSVLLLAVGCAPTVEEEEPYSFARSYEAGRTFGYQLTTTVRHDQAFQKREIGVSSHVVLDDATAERITWTSLSVEQPEGTTTDHSVAAQAVPPYEVSASIGGALELPELVVPEMTGMVTDLLTCFDWVHESWATPVVEGSPNNFQQVVDLGGPLMAMYGVEWFTIRSEVDLADGRLIGATMTNRLELRTLAGCDTDWADCAQEGSLLIERDEVLVTVAR